MCSTWPTNEPGKILYFTSLYVVVSLCTVFLSVCTSRGHCALHVCHISPALVCYKVR